MRFLLGFTVLALLAAGCIKGETSTLFKAHGEEPVAFAGYDYDGLTAQSGTGSADISVDAAKDTGTAKFTFTFAGKAWAVAFDKFAQTKPFQDGGVRNDFPEHGSSGNGDAMLPTLHALSAGWGTGQVSVDGALMTDPASGTQTFALHYMVTDTGVRDPATHKVTNSAGGAYDPAKPDDARVLQGTKQIYLNVQSSAPPQATNTSINVQSTLPTPGTDETKDIGTINGTGASIHAVYALQPPAAGLPLVVGQATFSLQADGKEVAKCSVQLDPTGSGSCTTDVPSAPAGKYAVHVTGDGAGTPYSVTGSISQAGQATFVHVAYMAATVG